MIRRSLNLSKSHSFFLILNNEIKSKNVENKNDVESLCQLAPDFKNATALVLCTNEKAVQINKHVKALPWQDGIKGLFTN